MCSTYRYICEYISACVLYSYTKFSDYGTSVRLCTYVPVVMWVCVARE